MASPEPYTIHVADANIEKLKRKLEDTDYPDELENDDQWRYGASLSDVKRLAEHWRTVFDWRKAEADINELPNYRKKVNVDRFGDIDVHFVWQKSEVEGAIPLLFCHGCELTPYLSNRITRSKYQGSNTTQGPVPSSKLRNSYHC
jgi:hypothetical protein